MKIFLILSLICSLGCATPNTNLNNLHLGMSKSEVLIVMGNPDSTKAKDNVETLVYIHEGTFWTWGHGIRPTREYWVTLQDGKVSQYGQPADFAPK